MTAGKQRSFRVTGESIIVLGFFALTLLYLFQTFSFERTMMSDFVGPAAFPQLLGGLGLVLVAIYALRARAAGPAEAPARRTSFGLEVATLLPLAPVLLYALLLEPFGFLPSTLVYILVTMRLFGQSWLKSLVYGVALTLAFFVLFYYALLADLPMGRLVPNEDLLPFIEDIRRAIERR